jgi:catalase
MLGVLARVDAELCAGVAAGLGLAAPKPTEPPPPAEPSPALSQLGRSWPLDGRTVGIVVDADLDGAGLARLNEARAALHAAGLVPLVVAPRGGLIDRDQTLPAQRSFATARSVEFDALLLAAVPAPGPGARVGLDAKAGAAAAVDGDAVDPRVLLLVDEAFRHGKAIAAYGHAAPRLAALGAPTDAPGVVTEDDAAEAVRGLVAALGEHRAWHRF